MECRAPFPEVLSQHLVSAVLTLGGLSVEFTFDGAITSATTALATVGGTPADGGFVASPVVRLDWLVARTAGQAFVFDAAEIVFASGRPLGHPFDGQVPYP